jgi:hypothetical protein
MNTTEIIARAICQHGKCKTCDADCIDYKAAQRVVKALESELLKGVSKDDKV